MGIIKTIKDAGKSIGKGVQGTIDYVKDNPLETAATVATLGTPVASTSVALTASDVVESMEDESDSESGNAASEISSLYDLFSQLLGAQSVDYDEISDFLQEQYEANLERFPEMEALASETAATTTKTLDDILKQQYEDQWGDLETKYGPVRQQAMSYTQQALKQTGQIASVLTQRAEQYQSGELPDDVRELIEQTRAEYGSSRGLYGQTLGNLTARDLGITSLELSQYGDELMKSAAALYENIPVTAQRMTSMAQGLMPSTTDPSSLYLNYLSLLGGGSVVSATTAMTTGASVAVANAEASWSAQLSALNAAVDVYSTETEAEAQDSGSSVLDYLTGGGSALTGLASLLKVFK